MGRQARVMMLAVLVAVTLAVGAAVFAAEEEPALKTVNDYKELRRDVEELKREDERLDKDVDRTHKIITYVLGIYSVLTGLGALVLGGLVVKQWVDLHQLRKSVDREIEVIKEIEVDLRRILNKANDSADRAKKCAELAEKELERLQDIKASAVETPTEELPSSLSEAEEKKDIIEETFEKYPGLRENTDFLYEAAMGKHITNEKTLLNTFRSLYFGDEKPKALDIINIMIYNKPNTPNYYYNKGVLLADLGRFNEAVEAYDRVIELNAQNADVYVNKGAALYKAGKNEEALAAYDKAIEFNPEDVDIYIDKGAVLNISGKYKEALSVLRKAIELNPELSRAYQGISYALIYLGRYDEAVEACDKAIELEPNAALAYNNRSCAYALLGKKDEMLADLRKATELDDKFREEAKRDESFDAFRDDPDFRRLVYPEEF